mgnify:CR=1 FL=1
MPLNEFATFLPKEPCSIFFYFTTLFTRIMPDLVQENAVLGSNFALFASCVHLIPLHFALQANGLQTVSLQSRGMIFLVNPSSMAVKYIFMMLFAIFA